MESDFFKDLGVTFTAVRLSAPKDSIAGDMGSCW